MDEFDRDNLWQKKQRNKFVSPFYAKHALHGRYVHLDEGKKYSKRQCYLILQRREGIDSVLQAVDDGTACIEEKIVRWPDSNVAHTRFCLETRSCTNPGKEKDGWMKYSEADYLLYAFQNATKDGLNFWIIDMPALKAWFWPRELSFKPFTTDQDNHSESRLVPIAEVVAAVPTWFVSAREVAGNIEYYYGGKAVYKQPDEAKP